VPPTLRRSAEPVKRCWKTAPRNRAQLRVAGSGRKSRFHPGHTGTAFRSVYGRGDNGGKRHSARLRGIEDYTNKYKGEQVEVALFGGDYQDGVLTAYCLVEDVAHLELNGHILIPLQNIASLHCSSRCDAPEPDWPPRGLEEDEQQDES
jgi:hypothetical protein